jgi:FkbM family methyltransferase
MIKKFTRQYPRLHSALVQARQIPGQIQNRIKINLNKRYLNFQLNSLKNIKFIQVGSNDGVSNDPLFPYIKKNGWKGVLVEPIPHHCVELEKLHECNANVSVCCAAISSHRGSTKFYTLNEEAKVLYPELKPTQLSSFDRNHIIKHYDGVLEDFIQEIDVNTLSLDDLIDDMGWSNIDLLHIDAEGFDFQVLMSLSLEKHRPKFIMLERWHLTQDDDLLMRDTLIKYGYSIREVYGDLLAIL